MKPLLTFQRVIGALAVAGIALIAGIGQPADPAATNPKIDFEKQVAPILAARCYECHGPKKQESGLRLDSKNAALKGGDQGPAIRIGKSPESLLIQAIEGTAETVSRMPEKGEPLTANQIATLKAWIDQGAIWPDAAGTATGKDASKHWAFQPPARPALAAVRDRAWPREPIDRFVAARLDREGIQPSPEADRITLARRMFLDLIGLPPAIDDVDRFVADANPDAAERLADRLLASPHHGERWGRHWLDAARYADSDGFEKDKSRSVWFYRDWVVGALNRDLPYNQFIVQQLAGDQLPDASQDQIVATGFLRHSMLNEEGGIDPEQFRMEAMFDRMDAIGKSVLGLTIQCAQCHTHKYDPLTHEEYYRLFAFINNDHESQRVVYTPQETMRIDALRREMQAIETGLQHRTPDWQARMAKWEAEVKSGEVQWEILAPDEYSEPGGGAKLSLLKDQSMLCAGYAPTKCGYRVVGRVKQPRITAVRLELLTDPNLPCGGPGRSFKGTCALTEIKIEAAPADSSSKKTTIRIAKAAADFSQPEAPLEPNFDDKSGKKRVVGAVSFAIDGKDDTAWGIDAGPGRRNQPRSAVFEFEKPIEFASGAVITVNLTQNHGGWNSDDHMNNLIGRFRLSVTTATSPSAAPLPTRVREILAIPAEQRTPAQTAAVFSHWRTTVAQWKEANDAIEELWRKWPAGATTLTLTARDQARQTSVLKRGDFLKPTKPATPGVPAFLHSLPADAPPTRLTFARWLTDRASPTTARVFANRVWQSYFGTGIVSTSEDFGMQSDPPSHPELLDRLACDFMDGDWSLKSLHRRILGSATYRQSSRVTPDLLAKDPYNRLLARGARFRVEAEIVRDIALSASGLLTRKLGGPAVFSPAPAFLFLPPASYAPFPWAEATGEERYRRALYTFRRRSTPYPMLTNFDAPNADFSCVRRSRSNTPLQALTTLNETVFMEAARALAWRTLSEATPNDDARVTHAFRLVTSRVPNDDERKELLSLLDRQKSRVADGWINPAEVATGKPERPSKVPPGATPTQLAVYTVLARVLLNLDEAITRE
jgi:hypothetical protein